MTTNRSRLTTAIGIALVALATLALVPCRLVAETPDAESLARLKEENANLKQQLEATRAEMESVRNAAGATNEEDTALNQVKRALEQYKAQADRHPDVLAKQSEIGKLQESLQRESHALLDVAGPRRGTARPWQQCRVAHRRRPFAWPPGTALDALRARGCRSVGRRAGRGPGAADAAR